MSLYIYCLENHVFNLNIMLKACFYLQCTTYSTFYYFFPSPEDSVIFYYEDNVIERLMVSADRVFLLLLSKYFRQRACLISSSFLKFPFNIFFPSHYNTCQTKFTDKCWISDRQSVFPTICKSPFSLFTFWIIPQVNILSG